VRAYDLVPVRLPRLAGRTFELFVSLLESPLTGPLLLRKTFAGMGVPYFRALQPEETPAARPLWDAGSAPAGSAALPPSEASAPAGFHAPTCEDYVEAYRSGRTTPEEVAGRALAAIEASDRAEPPLRAFVSVRPDDVRASAQASAERWRAGRPVGPLDGVPIAVKDELDVAGHPTRVGTSFLGADAATADSTAAARLRAAGALILGKAGMHEIGIGVTGFNPHHGTARNPHAPGHYTGGSSSGPASAVAAGLCPAALAADAGGSIRIPAGLCGVVGLKPTYGRVSSQGSAPLAWSLDHYGPIAVSARDAALCYSLLAGPDPLDPTTRAQPPVTLEALEAADLSGLTLGVFTPWFEDAQPAVVRVCRGLLDRLVERGARLAEVEVPELRAAQLAQLVLVASEMAAATERYPRRGFGLDVRANLALARGFTARDYLKAQRVRGRAMRSLAAVFERVDALVTPATAISAPPIRPDVLPRGESDLTALTALMRFAFLANLTGHPAISFPAGYDDAGLPVGLQAIGRPWDEALLLRLARATEPMVERRRPRVFFEPLPS